MIKPPKTSVELLKALGDNAAGARWQEFVNLYLPMLQEYCACKFPYLDADDVIQETFIALVKILPNYKYDPETNGYFHSYIRKVLHNKAVDIFKKEIRSKEKNKFFADWANRESEWATDPDFSRLLRKKLDELTNEKKDDDGYDIESSVVNMALAELNNNPDIQELTKIIFREVAIEGKKPAEVAEAHGITRNAVDQIRSRMVAHLKKIIDSLDPDKL